MGKTRIITVLIGLLALSAMLTAVLTVLYVKNVGAFRKLQPQLTIMNNQETMVRSLINETVEYGKTHPDIHPVLESLGIRMAGNPQTQNKP